MIKDAYKLVEMKTISKDWYTRSIRGKFPIFARYMYMWCAFNALYNLVDQDDLKGKSFMDANKIRFIVKKIGALETDTLITRNLPNIHYFAHERKPIKDMYKWLHNIEQPQELINFAKRFEDDKRPIDRKLGDIAMLLYYIRNNMAHGSKELDSYVDTEVARKAYPILRDIVRALQNKITL